MKVSLGFHLLPKWYVWKLLVLYWNTWYHIAMGKLFVFEAIIVYRVLLLILLLLLVVVVVLRVYHTSFRYWYFIALTKSSYVSMNLLSILAYFNNVVVWIISFFLWSPDISEGSKGSRYNSYYRQLYVSSSFSLSFYVSLERQNPQNKFFYAQPWIYPENLPNFGLSRLITE